ncbi:nucleotidyltransferase [Peribacillus loiseleuriae]|uniref:nucleotidyltransferase domain-containing protein n=1 Tax=Peribacillus loiseleuriae TaxID=1679170 RepID=UPI00382B7CE4
MVQTISKSILDEMIEQLDLPEYVVEQTVRRYKSLGEWFGRENSTFRDIQVDIFTQGSFALGTTNKPINNQEEYDLDMGCKVNVPQFKNQYSQEELKKMVGIELEKYSVAKGIKEELDEKHRCWRLEYKDEIKFHLDIVPCIPLHTDKQTVYKQQLQEAYQYNSTLNEAVANLAINITDNRLGNYSIISQNWHISNPEGYLKWFEDRMIKGEIGAFNERASVKPVPVYAQKTILQRCIQLLKRHRDNMFGDDERKPISIIITTLAARAYNGEHNLEAALINILERMSIHINNSFPRVPNPVNPNEDFTDRWDMPEGKKLDLEGNFKNWLLQAKVDFKNLLKTNNYETASLILNNKFSMKIEKHLLSGKYKYTQENHLAFAKELPKNPPKPWSDRY